MEKTIKLLAIYALLALWVNVAKAQATNVVLVVNIALSGFKQVGDNAMPAKITTRDILTLLNGSGQFNFGRSAQLVLISQEDQLPTFGVRERIGTSTTTTDISEFFAISEQAEVRANHDTAAYALQTFTFDDHNGTSFSVTGLTTLRRGRIISRGIGPLDRVINASSQVSGEGTVGGANAVLRGTINGGSARAEVD